MSTVPFSGVNWMALAITLDSTWCRRLGSPSIGGSPSGTCLLIVICLRRAAGRAALTTPSMRCGTETTWGSISSLPVMMREMSRMSSISWACALALRPMMSIAWRARSAGSVPASSICTQPRMALSGVRSSCDRVARKSSLSRLASSAEARRACSASLRGVTIMQTPLMRTGRPPSCSTRPLPSTQRSVPSGAIDAVLDVVRRAVVDGAAQRGHDPLAIVGVDVALVARERAVEGAGRDAVQPLEIVGPLHRLPRQVPVPGAQRRGVEDVAQVGFAAPRQRFGAGPLDGEGDVRGDQRRELQLLVGEGPRLVQVDHELADEPAQADQRDERHPGDPFGLDRRQERRQRRVLR